MAKVKENQKEEIDLIKVKEELTEYVNLEIKKNFKEELEKAYNKIIRVKSRKIVFNNFIIILLLCVIGFLTYLLYTNNYFNNYDYSDNNIKPGEDKTYIVVFEVDDKLFKNEYILKKYLVMKLLKQLLR